MELDLLRADHPADDLDDLIYENRETAASER